MTLSAKSLRGVVGVALLLYAVACYSSAETNTCQNFKAGQIEINMEVAKLAFTIPHGVDTDFGGNCRLFQPINISDDSIYKYKGNRETGAFFEYTWAFRGHLWQGWVGELLMMVTANKIPKYKVTEDLFPTSAPWMKWVKLNGVAWRRTGSIDSSSLSAIYYAVPLTGKHYLLVSFNFLDDSNRHNLDWQAKAQHIMDSVVQTMRFEGGNKQVK